MNVSHVLAFIRAKKRLAAVGYALKPHQVKGVKWMINNELYKEYKGGLVCDDPGLGKTIQSMGIIAANPKRLTLIVIPTSVMTQWTDIVKKVFGNDSLYLHYGNNRAKTRAELLLMVSTAKIVVTSYAMMSDPRDKSDKHTILHSVNWDRIIIDEGHQLRNPKTLSHRMACDLHSEHRWILSGTPVQNKKRDLISLFKCIGIATTISKRNTDFYIENYLLRRNKTLLFNDSFCDYDVVNHNIEFKTKEEQEIYRLIQEDSIREFWEKTEESNVNEHALMLEIIMRLRQASMHPQIAIDSLKKKFHEEKWSSEVEFNKISTKMNACIEKLEKVDGLSLVFCHFREEMHLMKKYLGEKGIVSDIYDGTLNLKKKNEVLERFAPENAKKKFKIVNKRLVKVQSQLPTVLLIQIKAGGVGLNLQQFSNIFILSPDWNPCNEIQAIARAHRIGQNGKVVVHKFTLVSNQDYDENTSQNNALTTIDQRILLKQMQKYNVMQNTLNDNTLVFRDKMIGDGRLRNMLTSSDLEYLVLGK